MHTFSLVMDSCRSASRRVQAFTCQSGTETLHILYLSGIVSDVSQLSLHSTVLQCGWGGRDNHKVIPLLAPTRRRRRRCSVGGLSVRVVPYRRGRRLPQQRLITDWPSLHSHNPMAWLLSVICIVCRTSWWRVRACTLQCFCEVWMRSVPVVRDILRYLCRKVDTSAIDIAVSPNR